MPNNDSIVDIDCQLTNCYVGTCDEEKSVKIYNMRSGLLIKHIEFNGVVTKIRFVSGKDLIVLVD